MQVQEFLQALDLISQVYRSRDGKKPADAVVKLRAQFVGYENLELEDWASTWKDRASSLARPPLPPTQDLEAILRELENAADDASTTAAFQKLDAIVLSADGWKRLAKLATARSFRSGAAAKEALKSYLANQVQLHNRRKSVSRAFT